MIQVALVSMILLYSVVLGKSGLTWHLSISEHSLEGRFSASIADASPLTNRASWYEYDRVHGVFLRYLPVTLYNKKTRNADIAIKSMLWEFVASDAS